MIDRKTYNPSRITRQDQSSHGKSKSLENPVADQCQTAEQQVKMIGTAKTGGERGIARNP